MIHSSKKIEVHSTRLKAQSSVLKALTHPTRLYIIDRLYKKPCCISELTEILGSHISTVSKHLSILRDADLIHDEKHGKTVKYFLKNKSTLDILASIDVFLKTQVKDRLAMMRDLEEEKNEE